MFDGGNPYGDLQGNAVWSAPPPPIVHNPPSPAVSSGGSAGGSSGDSSGGILPNIISGNVKFGVPDPAGCLVRIDYAHIADSVPEKNGFGAVKVNAYMDCQEPVEAVIMTVSLWKTGMFWDDIQRTTTNGTMWTQDWENENTWVRCTNHKGTTYYGRVSVLLEEVVNGQSELYGTSGQGALNYINNCGT